MSGRDFISLFPSHPQLISRSENSPPSLSLPLPLSLSAVMGGAPARGSGVGRRAGRARGRQAAREGGRAAAGRDLRRRGGGGRCRGVPTTLSLLLLLLVHPLWFWPMTSMGNPMVSGNGLKQHVSEVLPFKSLKFFC